MKKQSTEIRSVNDYIASLPENRREVVEQFRDLIKKIVPGVKEKISYQMPAFDYNGPLLWFGAFSEHYSLFPHGQKLGDLEKELKPYRTSKGTLQFAADKPLPKKLLKEIIKYRVKQNAEKTKSGKK
jgi:uncharacterized protein YdhG (YjbR/CyaY superfamily)